MYQIPLVEALQVIVLNINAPTLYYKIVFSWVINVKTFDKKENFPLSIVFWNKLQLL